MLVKRTNPLKKLVSNVKPLILTFIFLSSILINSCKSPFRDKITEGTIQYDILYNNHSGKSFPIQLLPKTMEFKFNKNFASYSIEDRVGLFSMCIVTNLKRRNHVTMIKVFDKKYLYQSEKKETPIFFSPDTKYNIEFSDDTFRLAGLLCKNANVVDEEGKNSFHVAYTMVDLSHPNVGTPYEKIDGLLMEFMLQMNNLNMKLTAKKVDQKEINDQDFNIPKGYKLISKKQMEDILTTLLP